MPNRPAPNYDLEPAMTAPSNDSQGTPSVSTTSTAADSPAAPQSPGGRRSRLALAVALPLVVASCVAWRVMHPPLAERVLAENSALALDLSRPDALIESASLSQLPKDLLRIPLLHDTLTEDFVYYYEGNADRLGVAGALRRIVYEHDLSWKDSLINELLDQPAEVALWRGDDGKLGHILISIERGALAKMLQPLAQVAASDTQLAQVGELHVDGDAAPVYRLRYNYDRALLLVAWGDHLLLLSSPEMLQESAAADSPLGKPQVEALERLLGDHSPYAQRFALGKRKATHRLTLSAQYLALGYGQFIPQLAGIRMEMLGDGWQGYLALNPAPPAALQWSPLWQSMPMGAAACAAVPVAQEALQPLFERLISNEMLAPELSARLGGPVALCWYGKSRLHTPLLVTRMTGADLSGVDPQLGQTFAGMVGAFEEKTEDGRFPVEQSSTGDAQSWKRVVGSSFGLHTASEFSASELLSNDRYFRIALARKGDTLLFSLDDELVDAALATLDKRYPPLAEQLPADVPVPLYLAADSLATLLEKETLASLPADMEAVFHNAAQSNLLPKLHALGGHQHYALTLPAGTQVSKEWTWLPLSWKAL